MVVSRPILTPDASVAGKSTDPDASLDDEGGSGRYTERRWCGRSEHPSAQAEMLDTKSDEALRSPERYGSK